jgi:hypothetical protein
MGDVERSMNECNGVSFVAVKIYVPKPPVKIYNENEEKEWLLCRNLKGECVAFTRGNKDRQREGNLLYINETVI